MIGSPSMTKPLKSPKHEKAASPRIQHWPIAKPKPYEHNPRKIPASAIDKVAVSISEFGFQQPIVVDTAGVIIAGHTRLAAAKQLNLKTVPVIQADLPEAKARAYRPADNRTAQETSWLDDMLADELGALEDMDFDLDAIGFDEHELRALLTDDEELERAEQTPDVPEEAVSKLGDLWHLGEHRVYCGDATNAGHVAQVLQGLPEGVPHLMVTDPPYGVEYDPKWRDIGWTGARSTNEVANDDRSDWTDAYKLFSGDVAYVWHPPGALQIEFFQSLVAAGFEIRMQMVWAKQHFPIGRGNYHVQHEPCWYAVRKGRKAQWQGSRKESTLWQIANRSAFGGATDDASTRHSTQKPIDCMRKPIWNNSAKGDAVYDPFLGSGTTLIAAEMEDRICYGLELHPPYVDVIVQRWQDFTGQEATRLDGKRFNDLQPEAVAA